MSSGVQIDVDSGRRRPVRGRGGRVALPGAPTGSDAMWLAWVSALRRRSWPFWPIDPALLRRH